MKFALICYPSEITKKFLSFTEKKSKFELGIGGRNRVIDFVFSLARHIDVRHIILYENQADGNLQDFLQNYLSNQELMKVHLLQKGVHDFLNDTLEILKSSRVDAVIMYNADNPALFDIKWMVEKFIEINRPKISFLLKKPLFRKLDFSRANFRILFTRRETFINQLRKIQKESGHTPNIFERVMNESIMKSTPIFKVEGFFGLLSNITDYYKFNMKILHYQDLIEKVYGRFQVGSFMIQKGNSVIHRNAHVYNSIISEKSEIKGVVVDSIIFPGVHIGKETEIVSSVILPNNRIGDFARVYHALIEEAEVKTGKDETNHVGDYCLIGKMSDQIIGFNFEYPELLKDGLTVIGRNCMIPRKVKIGANCYISPETNKLKIKMYNRVIDGATL